MKKILLPVLLSLMIDNSVTAQILCINCFRQNDSISKGVTNLVSNGGFETTPCIAWNGVIYSFCPSSSRYTCDIANWTCTGGSTSSYPCMMDLGPSSETIIVQGSKAAYFGNGFNKACSQTTGDTSCLVATGCETTGIPPGYPTHTAAYGGTSGISLSQTVSGLIPGNVYVLEFWSGGERYFTKAGLFAVDIGFGYNYLRDPETPTITGIGERYVIQWRATSASHTIKFTSWGHMCSDCTELMLDDVRLYTLAQLSPSVTPCVTGTPPVADFISSDTAFCNEGGQCIDFTDKSTNNPTSWKWSFPGAVPDTSTMQNPTGICYYTPGTYAVTLIVKNANGSDTINVSPMITFSAGAAQPFLYLSGDTLFCSHASAYQWYLNGSVIANATDSFYVTTGTGPGIYSVQITDSNGCARLSTGFPVIVKEISASSGLKIYPNPVNFSFTLQFNTQLKDAELIIFDMVGKEVMRIPHVRDSGDKIELERGNLESGIYFVKVRAEERQWVQKIVVE